MHRDLNNNNWRGKRKTVLIDFGGEAIPERIFLGFVSFPVRMYMPMPLRCFNDQRFGHTAKNSKVKWRCARCRGDHEYGKCGPGAVKMLHL